MHGPYILYSWLKFFVALFYTACIVHLKCLTALLEYPECSIRDYRSIIWHDVFHDKKPVPEVVAKLKLSYLNTRLQPKLRI